MFPRFTCPVCGEPLDQDEEWTGPPSEPVTCPECGYRAVFTREPVEEE
jgi:predicted RNA-binding Zn-ribbon protein involved in translation (DUF1610 family)